MDTDQQVVMETDLALVAATQRYQQAEPWEKVQMRPSLDDARAKWATARYRLLFPDSVTVEQDVADAKELHHRIDAAADTQQMIQALVDLAGLLVKFAH